ncbi:MAG: hypothetical protein K2V38_11680, partial [Gemmataceae bacterium]|nr:hypothetical protein [Gemmataceae bacterium]
GAVPTLLGALAAQFGLGSLPQDLRKAVAFVPTKVNEAMRQAVAKIAAKVTGAIGGAEAAAAGAVPVAAGAAAVSGNQRDNVRRAFGADTRLRLPREDLRSVDGRG